jgi:hypothetical protein
MAGVCAVAFAACCGAVKGQAPNSAGIHAVDAASGSSAVVLPIEVLGPDGTTATRQFTIPDTANLDGRLKLWLEIHGLRYEMEASLQLNGGPWTPINSETVAIQGLGAAFGGIGGGYSTLKMTMSPRLDAVRRGVNTLTFRFNGTDGIRSGFRVLGFNVLGSKGERLIPPRSFAQDDPSKWQPPFTSSADIRAGKTLWNTAALVAPGLGALRAKCSSCHAQDGRDLKYFNYSNLSIRARSMFHGLTEQQGDQIASYIRSLNVPNPGRPWNPPYQPGPGLDSQPVANWAAGAGLDAVLDSDAAMLPYLAPGGSTAGWSANSYLNAREIPINMQLPDWNSWLPQIHPMDAFGSSFTSHDLNNDFAIIRSKLQPDSPAAYAASLGAFHNWELAGAKFSVALESNTHWDANRRMAVYSLALWRMVKNWEINQEFGLEAMPQVPFGAKADVRGWLDNGTFYTAPNMLHIPVGPGIGNGSKVASDYLDLAWYQMQLLLNDGQGSQNDHNPLDYGYVSGAINNVYVHDTALPGIMLELEWGIKSLQEYTQTGNGPQVGLVGWSPTQTTPLAFVLSDWLPLWSGTSPTMERTLTQAYTQAWFNQASKYTPQQYYQGGKANPAEDPAKLNFITTFGGQVWYMLPRLRLFGVDPSLTNRIAAWASTIWPAGNWSLNDSTTCSSAQVCTSGH